MVNEVRTAAQIATQAWVEAQDPISLAGLQAVMGDADGIQVAWTLRHAAIAVLAFRTIDDDAVDRVRELHEQHGLRVILLVDELDEAGLLRVVAHGVAGVLLRHETTAAILRSSVLSVGSGGGILSPALLGQLLDSVGRLGTDELRSSPLSLTALTEREVAVLRLLADGYDTAEIAAAVNYSVRTVKATVAQAVRHLGLRNRTQAVAHAVRMGLI